MSPTTELPAAKPFAQFIREQRKTPAGVPRLHDELTEALQQVVAGVMEHGKAGKLTIAFTIKPQGEGAVQITDQWAVKVPTPPASPSIFFADDEGRLSRDRLDQEKLPFEGIDGGAATTTTQGARTA